MKNLVNNIFLITLLFLIPLFAEGKSGDGKSLIQQVKERIVKEKEKQEDKKSDETGSRIEEVKDKIVKEEKKEKEKAEVKNKAKNKDKSKGEDKRDYDRDYKNKQGRDYVKDDNKKYHKKKDGGNYRSDGYWVYDGVYFDGYATDVVYDDYAYIDEAALISPNPMREYKKPRKIISLSSSVEAAYLGKDILDTYGVTGKISANLYALHFNCFYQNIFSNEEKLTIYSVNGGVSLALGDVVLTPFVGAFYIEPLEEARFSYGADLQIFLPYNYNLDFYTINSSYGSLNFNSFSASLNREFYILNAGLGYNYNNYAGIDFSGPFARLSFSF